MPARIELTKTDLRSLAKDYRTMGLAELAETWLLTEAGVEIRPRGVRPS